MRVLWFSVTPSLYGQNTVHHNGGGWVESLERILKGSAEVELGIAFEHKDNVFKSVQDGVTYYPISANVRVSQKILRKISIVDECDALLEHASQIIEDFQPDLIHVFGSESCFGLLGVQTEIPVVIHMQGSLPSYANARFPPGYSRFDFIRASRGNPLHLYRSLSNDATFCKRALREERILRSCRHFMGRTEWDEAITSIYNPARSYNYCAEAIRSQIYDYGACWETRTSDTRIELVSTLSMPLYKGADLILKTAKLLSHELGFHLHWKVFGVAQWRLHEDKTGIQASDCGVELMGIVEVAEIRDALLQADLYVHPSYIDNSPNSLCEAQVLGVPVVATNVGGVSSLIQHDITGYLVPANDPYMLAQRIRQLSADKTLATQFGQRGMQIARERHDPTKILADLLMVYRKLVKTM